MASGLEVFLIIFILLLVIAGICLAIYFVWRHDQKKRGPTSAPINGGGGGSTGATDPTGPAPPSGQLSIRSGANNNNYFYLKVQSFPVSSIPVSIEYFYNFEIANTISNNICDKGFVFTYDNFNQNNVNIPGALIWSTSTPAINTDGQIINEPILLGATKSENGARVAAGNPLKQNWDYSWKYDSTNKTWCLASNPTLCINADKTTNTVTINTVPTPAPLSFQWDNVLPLNRNCAS